MSKGKNCRKCNKELCQIDIDIHPLCMNEEEKEKNVAPPKPPTEFDKGLLRYLP